MTRSEEASADGPRSGMRDMAGAWLAHPVTMAAIGVMVINDHVLKAEFGTWWTGKLSDVAGLVFFPALVGFVVSWVAPRLRADALLTLSLAITAVGFTWVKATDQGAASASALLTALGWPSTVLRDPTDLIALASLALAAWVARRVRTAHDHSRTRMRWRVAVVAPVALLASVATSEAGDFADVDVVENEGVVYGLTRSIGSNSSGFWTAIGPPGASTPPTVTDEELDALAAASDVACFEGEPDTCFRPTPGRYGVDISHDGGNTWEAEVAITDLQWERLADEYILGDQKEAELITFAVTTVAVDGEEWVVAANGADQFAVRYGDGTWERVGDWREGSQDSVPPMPSADPGDDTSWVPFMIIGSAGCAMAAAVVLGLARGRRADARARPAGTAVVGVVLLVLAGVGMAVGATGATAFTAVAEPPESLRPHSTECLGLF